MEDEKKNRPARSTGSRVEDETAPTGTGGQHWRGEPWAKNPKVGGREPAGSETGPGTSGQHWRGEDMPAERRESARPGTAGKEQSRMRDETASTTSDRPDEC